MSPPANAAAAASFDDLERRVRELERSDARAEHLGEELRVLRNEVADAAAKAQPVAKLTDNLERLSKVCTDLQAELAGFKGKVAGAIGVALIFVPIATALLLRFMKAG